MKKIIMLSVLVALCIGLSGCGEKSDDEIVANIEEKIKDAGWKIEHEKDSSKVEDFLKLVINGEESFSFTLNKQSKLVEYVSYENKKGANELFGYNTDSLEDDLYISYGTTTCSYNPITSTINESSSTSAFCKQEAPEKAKKIKQKRDALLEKENLTLKELYTWCAWYHTTND